MAFKIYDERLGKVPEQLTASGWDEMIAWAQDKGMHVGKRRTEWDRDKASVLGIHDDVAAYVCCTHQGGIRAVLVETK